MFTFPAALETAKTVTEYLDGWGCDISGVRTWEALPKQAQAYVEYIEKAIGCHIGYVSVGAERDPYRKRGVGAWHRIDKEKIRQRLPLRKPNGEKCP